MLPAAKPPAEKKSFVGLVLTRLNLSRHRVLTERLRARPNALQSTPIGSSVLCSLELVSCSCVMLVGPTMSTLPATNAPLF